MTPFLKWVGGKRQLLPELLARVPRSFKSYYEPFVGGAIGILLGRGTSLLVRWKAHWPTEASLWTIVAAVAVSVGVGIVFGFYPAWRAARVRPLDAIRSEGE